MTLYRVRLLAGPVVLAVSLSLGVGASDARPAARGSAVTISMIAASANQPVFNVLIANFQRVYPNITVNISYTPSSAVLYQLEATELAAGNAPDLVTTYPGCGTPISVCTLAQSGYLAPMVNKPWVKWSLPLVTSAEKHGQGLFTFEPTVSAYGIFTNDALFKQLGLKVPQTFSQLLEVCQKAKAAGTVAVLFPGANQAQGASLIVDLAVATLYGKDKQWAAELRAGKVSFDGTPGWQQALQEFVAMNNAGCFEPGVAGTATVTTQFALGQSLMYPGISAFRASIGAANPQFSYSLHPFPGGAAPNQTSTVLSLNMSLSVSAHSNAQNQAAAQTFVDFIARPKQNALYAQVQGGLTQYEFLKGQIPAFMSAFVNVFKQHEYVVSPMASWWNANVALALQQDVVGLITGQLSIDDVLNAMDAAWKQGPA